MEIQTPPLLILSGWSSRINPKQIFYDFLKESFSYIPQNGNSKKLFIFKKTEISYISGNGTLLNSL